MGVRSRDRRATSALDNKDAVGRAVATVEVRVVRVIDIGYVNVGRLVAHLNDHTAVHRHRISRDDLHAVAAQEHVADENHRTIRSIRRVSIFQTKHSQRE